MCLSKSKLIRRYANCNYMYLKFLYPLQAVNISGYPVYLSSDLLFALTK